MLFVASQLFYRDELRRRLKVEYRRMDPFFFGSEESGVIPVASALYSD